MRQLKLWAIALLAVVVPLVVVLGLIILLPGAHQPQPEIIYIYTT